MPSSGEFRMPQSVEEARTVYERWDGLNGRYYVKADVRLDDGSLHRDVVVDADTLVVVEAGGCPMYEQPTLIGREVIAFVVTRDRSPDRRYPVVTEHDRETFAKDSSWGASPTESS